VRNKSTILKSALLGLCFAVSFRTAAADATNVTTKPLTAARPVAAASEPKLPRLGATTTVQKKARITKFSEADDSLGRHFSRFSGPLGPTLTIPGATFLRGPLTPRQMGQLYSESIEIGEGEVFYEFPPGTALRKAAVTQVAQKN
jgi:hypothetical protein